MAIGRTRRETGAQEPVAEGHTDQTRTGETTAAGTPAGETRTAAPRTTDTRTGTVAHDPVAGEARARDRFGGANWGAAFFGWIVAVGIAALLTGIVGAVAAAVGDNTGVTQSDAERAAGTVGVATGIVLLVILMIAYYAGGYVAGRMSRFDGARQGAAAWLIGLVLTVIAVVLGWVAGDQYNVFDRVDLPRIPIPKDDFTLGGIIAVLAVLVGTLLAAVLGGKVGTNYHRRVDREF